MKRTQIAALLEQLCTEGAALFSPPAAPALSPRDRTPEATRRVIDREAPGLAEAMRSLGAAKNKFAWLSRGVAGMKGPDADRESARKQARRDGEPDGDSAAAEARSRSGSRRPGTPMSAQRPSRNLREEFGQIDIYLFDQILRGHITPRMRVLDAGCGYGRNLVYLLREGCEVFGIDSDASSIAQVRALAASLQPDLPPGNFQAGVVESMAYANDFADVVIASALLHFARDEEHFRAMLSELWRVLRPGGVLFCRLGSRDRYGLHRAAPRHLRGGPVRVVSR